MGLSSGFESNAIGLGGAGFPTAFAGGFGGGYGGFGGIAPIGLVGLNNLFDRDGRGHGCNDECGGVTSLNADGIAAKTAALVNQNADQNALLGAIAANNATTVAEGRALGSAICEAEKTTLNQFYANAVQQARLAQDIQNQASAIAIVADKRFDDLTAAGVNQTASILSRINDIENQNLRDQLFESRRGRDRSDLEISIQNTNTNVQAQLQGQLQAQLQAQLEDERRRWSSRENEINIINTNTNINAQAQAQAQAQSIRDLDRDHRWNSRFDALLAQSNKSNQDIVNLGTMVASGTQTPTSTNVHSKQA